AHPEAALAVAAAVIEAHARPRMPGFGPSLGPQHLIFVGCQAVDAVFHGTDPAAAGQAGHAAQLLAGTPAGVLLVPNTPAMQCARLDVDPVQGLFTRMPDGTFSRLVAQVQDQFGLRGRTDGPAHRRQVFVGSGGREGATLVDPVGIVGRRLRLALDLGAEHFGAVLRDIAQAGRPAVVPPAVAR